MTATAAAEGSAGGRWDSAGRRAAAARRPRLAAVSVLPVGDDGAGLAAAAGLAREWAGPPFDEEQALKTLAARRGILLLAVRNGAAAGLLHGAEDRDAAEGAAAFAPLVWARGLDARGRRIPMPERELAVKKMTAEFLAWARRRGAASAALVFRPGQAPGAAALAELGLVRRFRALVRKAPLPGDPVSGRVRWHSTEPRAARGQEMNLSPERMFPELFLDRRDLPPPARRLEPADLDAAAAVVRASRAARGRPFDEDAFRRLFRRAAARRDYCILGTTDERAGDGRLAGALIGATTPHPFSNGRVARVVLLEWDAGGARLARRAARGLWRGFMFWSHRSMARTMLMAAPEGKFGDEFARACRLSPFGFCYGATLDAAPDEEEEYAPEDGENRA